MSDVLSSPCRVNERSRTLYFFDGYVAVDILSGTEEQQKAVLALVGQAQRMAHLLSDVAGGWCSYSAKPAECGACHPCRARVIVRDAGLMSGGALESEGR